MHSLMAAGAPKPKPRELPRIAGSPGLPQPNGQKAVLSSSSWLSRLCQHIARTSTQQLTAQLPASRRNGHKTPGSGTAALRLSCLCQSSKPREGPDERPQDFEQELAAMQASSWQSNDRQSVESHRSQPSKPGPGPESIKEARGTPIALF